MAAFDGTASVVWMAVGFSCGYLGDALIWQTEEQEEGRSGELAVQACFQFNHIADDVLTAEMQPCDVVIIHNSHYKMLAEDSIIDQQRRLRRLQRLVEGKGAHLVLLGDVAGLNSRQPQMCLAGLANACQRSWDEVSYEFSLERMMYDELATTSNSTFHMRIAELFCSLNGECGVYIPGTTTSAYADAEHISNAGATYLWPYIASFFIQNGLLQQAR